MSKPSVIEIKLAKILASYKGEIVSDGPDTVRYFPVSIEIEAVDEDPKEFIVLASSEENAQRTALTTLMRDRSIDSIYFSKGEGGLFSARCTNQKATVTHICEIIKSEFLAFAPTSNVLFSDEYAKTSGQESASEAGFG